MFIRESKLWLFQLPPDAHTSRVRDLHDGLEGWLNMLPREDASHARLSHAYVGSDNPLFRPDGTYLLPEALQPVGRKAHSASSRREGTMRLTCSPRCFCGHSTRAKRLTPELLDLDLKAHNEDS